MEDFESPDPTEFADDFNVWEEQQVFLDNEGGEDEAEDEAEDEDEDEDEEPFEDREGDPAFNGAFNSW